MGYLKSRQLQFFLCPVTKKIRLMSFDYDSNFGKDGTTEVAVPFINHRPLLTACPRAKKIKQLIFEHQNIILECSFSFSLSYLLPFPNLLLLSAFLTKMKDFCPSPTPTQDCLVQLRLVSMTLLPQPLQYWDYLQVQPHSS